MAKLFSDMPSRMWRLPVDERGYPVPRFVKWIDGKPDFRIMDDFHFAECIRRKLCWICGQPLGRWKVFVIGPMCSVNRVSSEPPSHRACATFAVKHCPFLSHPQRRRDDRNMPEHVTSAGVMLEHNPGATLLWVTDRYTMKRAGGILFNIGEPREVEWWANGRFATRAEVQASFDKGLPQLLALAQDADDHAMIDKNLAKALALLPKETADA